MSDRMPAERVSGRRAVIDRRAVADRLRLIDPGDNGAARAAAVALLRSASDAGRGEIARRLQAAPTRGQAASEAYAFLSDELLRLICDFTVQRLYPNNNPSDAERIALIAVGGFGRAEMAPFSDVDIGFLTPWKRTGWAEQVIETVLYALWDMGLSVGHSSRSLDEMIRLARADHMIRTSLLESRFIWGDRALHAEALGRFDREVIARDTRDFIAAKLAERNARHLRMGDSRYVVEPNIKEGKGGLRDLHALFWIGKHIHQVRHVDELVGHGLLTADELRTFRKLRNFLLAVRCHLHLVAGRAEERLTFDFQAAIARRMNYADRAGRSAVERFMQDYFLVAKKVGDLTGVFLAHLDERYAGRGRRFDLPSLRRRPRGLDGFTLDRGRLSVPADDFFREEPARLIEMFALADRHGIEVHPRAMRLAGRDAKLVMSARGDARANAMFLDVLTSPRDPEMVLRWMNEAGVFGRFIPDFGRVVAQMQFDMYHHYTVDEHTIRAIGLLAKIERGQLGDEHPLSTALMARLGSRRALYVAVLLHDIAKGRGGDHSVLGAAVADRLCPRLGLDRAETQLVAWLVRHHLVMSATAFKRDLSDPRTIEDFVATVKSPERLNLLLILTVVDIGAVGPGVWNAWKRRLLTDLFEAAEERLRLGHKQRGRRSGIEARQLALAKELAWPEQRMAEHIGRMPEAYWIAEPPEILASNARQMVETDTGGVVPSILSRPEPAVGATLVTVYAEDRPGLFYRIAGAIHLAGGNIIGARIYTSRDGMALDNIVVQDGLGQAFADPTRIARLEKGIADGIADRDEPADIFERPTPIPSRARAFRIAPVVLIDNRASSRYTVIEVNALDRPALLAALARALFRSKAMLRSAHIATYGERAVDTFYVTDTRGGQITPAARLKELQERLLEAAGGL